MNIKLMCALRCTKDIHDKYYFMFLYDNNDLEVHWGRFGAFPQKKIYKDAGTAGYNDKMNEKLYRKGYEDVTDTMSNPGGSKAPFKHPAGTPSRRVSFKELNSPQAITEYMKFLSDNWDTAI